ncbi:hypothetical protein CVT25_005125 [Psilocybe cyanescens]|uniref:Uncharacterized protein n=1 Tax=Psilocybe cyanescens TaxID=93625 RepID=A0A409XBW8_PSICY|nr:hypothetical protein CVT25_005125 [Psilocybe cyanescens]
MPQFYVSRHLVVLQLYMEQNQSTWSWKLANKLHTISLHHLHNILCSIL